MRFTDHSGWLAVRATGRRHRIGHLGPFWWNSRASMWLKGCIDRRFLDAYRKHAAG
jgi:hypothetical protein